MPTDSESHRWQPGDVVRFLRPDLAGHSGVVSEVLLDGRVLVEVTVFGRTTTFEVNPGDVTTTS